MAYTGYEVSAGDAMNRVEALCKTLTDAGVFSTTTQPTLAEVEDWLTDGKAQVNLRLARYGYSKDQTDADVVRVLMHLNALWAAAQVEFSNPSQGFSPEEGSRGEMFLKQFEEQCTVTINNSGFEELGGTKASDLTELSSAGGIRYSDKETIENDTDIIPYAFTRGRFNNGLAYSDRRSDL